MNIPANEYFKCGTFRHFSLPVTDACNLKCPCCSTMSNIPIKKQSNMVHRRNTYILDGGALTKFCDDLGDIGRGEWHRLTGGEPTLYPDVVRECIDILSSYERPVCLFTNGFRASELEPRYLHRVGWIELDDHGPNHTTVFQFRKYLKQIGYKGKLRVIKYNTHYDLEYARCHPKNDVYCGHMCRVIMLFDRVIYPCAHHYCVELFQNWWEVTHALAAEGFHLENEGWVKLLQNLGETWREKLPQVVQEVCNDCWRPYWRMKKLEPMEVVK